MKRLVVARQDLLGTASAWPRAAVLLEGSWPQGGGSLDDAIDARFDWIDEAAVSWAERLNALTSEHEGHEAPAIGAAWLNALALRYYLVKLLRVVAYFTEVEPLAAYDSVELVAERGRDEDYADLIAQLCRCAGASFQVHWVDRPTTPASGFPPNRPWRRALARLARALEPRAAPAASARVVLCGNPRLLGPVGEALLQRRCRLWWLYDRFALGCWLRWRPRGVGQLWCDGSEGRENCLPVPAIEGVQCRGIDLAGPLRRWFAARLQACGARQTRIVEQIERHFERLRPHALVLDEDATPMARAAVAVARRCGATSLVVQHGAPCCSFGFAPLAADRILVWGQASAEQLQCWGVPPARIEVVGSPQHDRLYRQLTGPARGKRCKARSGQTRRLRRILLVATVAPRDDRPDAVGLHMTRRAYAEILRAAVATLAAIPDTHLVVKLHPRAPHDPILPGLLAEYPSLSSRIVRGGTLADLLGDVNCVLSCGSSAGVDATLAGLPVIQLLPAGSGAILPHDRWGLAGTARNADELKRLLEETLAGSQPAARPDPHVFHALAGSSERIADVVLRAATPAPCSSRAPDCVFCSQG